MDSDREYGGGGRVPLPGWRDTAAAQRTAPGAARENGVRQLRRMSAWSAAALIVGTGAATAAFAHSFMPSAPSASPATATGTSGAAVAAGGTGQSASGPGVTHSVATTSPSGVTTMTTTHTVGGKTVVTHVRQGATYQDN